MTPFDPAAELPIPKGGRNLHASKDILLEARFSTCVLSLNPNGNSKRKAGTIPTVHQGFVGCPRSPC